MDTYEKKYKESMAKMSAFLAKHNGFTISKDGEMYKDLSEIFPELKESEDEKIRKALIDWLPRNCNKIGGILISNIIAWLDKKRYSEFELENEYWRGYDDAKKQGEKKPTEWSEDDEKQARQIERIVHDDGCTQKLQKQIADWLKSLKDRCVPQQKQEWNNDDEYHKNIIIKRIKDEFSTTSFDVEYRRQLENALDWLENLKNKAIPRT